MICIVKDFSGQIVICIFEVMSGLVYDVLDVLSDVYDQVIWYQFGYILGVMYLNDVQMCIVIYL